MSIRSFQGILPTIAETAYIDESAVVIGKVSIGEHSSIWPMAVVRGDVNSITIGAYTNIQDGSILHVTHDGKYTPGGYKLTIGDYITVGHKAILHACTLGDYCLIGMASTIMDGAVLAPRIILAAGSLVPSGKTLEGGYLWMGSPAKKIRPLNEQELASLEYSAAHYAKLKEQHRVT
jgi:carbonic anhydrase/acetyltransferase-like protein (isoleucine patch superfamily)